MDFVWFETFLTVARCGSFSAASGQLHLTQPGVSRQVQRLEHELGVALFDRGGAVVRLTPAGVRFRDYAEVALERHRAVLEELRGEPVRLAGDLRIAASSTPGEFLVPDLVATFVQRHAAVCPHVFIADSAIVEEEVRAARWDIGFVGAQMARRGLRYRPVVEDEVVLAVPANHPFAGRGEVALDELAGQPVLEREGGSGTAASVARALAERGLRLPPHQTVMVLGSSQAIVSAVERGLGIGWVSSLALAGRRRDRVGLVRLAGLPVRRVLSLVDDPNRPLSPAAAAFVDWVGQRRQPRCSGW